MAISKEPEANKNSPGVAQETSVQPRYSPSRAMEATLNEMWCCPITNDAELVAEIQLKVEAKCDVCLRSYVVPSLFPGFVGQIMKYAELTQEDIDDAWYDAAIDLLGRPAIQHASNIDDYTLYADREDPYDASQHDFLRMPNMWPDDQEIIEEAFTSRPAIRPRSMIGSHMAYTDWEDRYDMSITWLDDRETHPRASTGRPTILPTSTTGDHMIDDDGEDPYELYQHDGQRTSRMWLGGQETTQQASTFADVESTSQSTQFYNHDFSAVMRNF